MGLIKFKNIGIKAISATVPKKIVKTNSLTDFFPKEQIEKFIETTGVEERRFIDKNKCASDLCYDAACQLFEKTDINRDDIDVLLFISQTPDYKTPGMSIVLQNKLGLSKTTIVYDINMSCSGFVHGLLMAYTFLQLPNINNVLVLVGDTLSKMTSLNDKSTGLLFGDGGIASLITKGEQYGESWFSMNTDGAYFDSVIIPAGGSRIMSSCETLQQTEYEDGSKRNLEQIVMNGVDVFSFAISELPKDVKRLLAFANVSIDDVDKYAFHQANKLMTEYIAKKLKANPEKLLRSIHKYGNTSGVSIPLTMVENKELIHENDTILMNAIGAGFTYGTILLNIADCQILGLNEL
ncbi:3-oxoacyl-[acyl-carrier-protein] synthase 3 [termite gut metagenome]|uniref:3-oxoacyl-[acyl-carrier-protein] synthase 3 n=1 Tax=termite gut metagenome TaxID=433724 RepID=A0A5J4SLT8_9ZZZZ